MISVIFLFLAALCNSAMDTISHHWFQSIFFKIRNKGIKNWFKSDWRNAYINRDVKRGKKKIFANITYPAILIDGWHCFKGLMIIFVILSLLTVDTLIFPDYLVIYYGISWYVGFNLGYKYLFVK